MAEYPYISGQGGLVQAMKRLRKGVPTKVDASYLQRFNIAPANESYVISILRFLNLIDEEGKPVEGETDFLFGSDEAFQAGLDKAVKRAYSQLFDEMGDDAATADKADLTHWFRAADKTSAVVGQRQASTFLTLAALAGTGEVPEPRQGQAASKGATPRKKAAKKSVVKKAASKRLPAAGLGESGGSTTDVGLSVRIEVNLPANGDAATYDAIFASIRKHLMS